MGAYMGLTLFYYCMTDKDHIQYVFHRTTPHELLKKVVFGDIVQSEVTG